MPERLSHFSIIGNFEGYSLANGLVRGRRKFGAPETQGWYIQVQGEMEGFRFDRKLMGAAEPFFSSVQQRGCEIRERKRSHERTRCDSGFFEQTERLIEEKKGGGTQVSFPQSKILV